MNTVTDNSVEYTVRINWRKVAVIAWYISCMICGTVLQIWLLGFWGFVAFQSVMVALGIWYMSRRYR